MSSKAQQGEPDLLWVDPMHIDLVYRSSPSRFIRTAAPVMGGDWDMPRAERFHELDVHQALEAHLVHGKPWKSTIFYTRVISDIEAGKEKWGCRSARQFRRRLAWLEQLYCDIRDQGYKTQRELGCDLLRHEIVVAIRRDGSFLFIDGRHRLSIARLLRLPSIPAYVVTRHEEWMRMQCDDAR